MKPIHTVFLAGMLACVIATAIPPAAAQDANTMTSDADFPHKQAPRADLLTGGQPEASAWAGLAASGVTTVINLRAPAELGGRDERAEVTGAGLAYREVPVDGTAGITWKNARILQSLLTDARADGKGTVVVHCASGNRVGALLALGAIDAGMSPEQAIASGREAGMTSAEARVRAVLAAGAAP